MQLYPAHAPLSTLAPSFGAYSHRHFGVKIMSRLKELLDNLARVLGVDPQELLELARNTKGVSDA